MENKFIKFSPNSDWSDYTFIFTCVSVGNIGQLAADLLISSFPNTNKAGYLISSLVQPIVGADPYIYKSSETSISCELFENANLKLVVFQQRAPLFRGKRDQFLNLLIEFVKREQFKEIICLTSSAAYERIDSQLVGIQCRYLSVNKNESIEKLDWKILEKRTIDYNHNNQVSSDENDETKTLNTSFSNLSIDFIPGGGIAQKFYKISKEQNLNSYVLIVFAHEGNNIPEAFQLVNYLNEWKMYLKDTNSSPKTINSPSKESNKNWRIPISWKFLFGQSIDQSVVNQIF